MTPALGVAVCLLCGWLSQAQRADEPEPLPLVEVSRDNTVIDHSCRVRIAPGLVIADADGNGVIQIQPPVDNGIIHQELIVRFEPGSVLRGGPAGTSPDQYSGTGIRINSARNPQRQNVRLSGVNVQGFKVGVWADAADGLVVESATLDDLWRQHLLSTTRAEDGADWLWPHQNDHHEWVKNYGAAVYVEDSGECTLSNITVRRGQNGIVLAGVNNSKVFDNDCSFLSGWGVAMWRSSGNTVSRNALDFCIRGYSHGVYNRGQDSAGLLMFEQCSRNQIIENSITHGGDGIFGFAGKAALGENPPLPPPSAAGTGEPKAVSYDRLGCNDNLIVGNDLSYAAAHGLEMTFSFGNEVWNNRVVANGICGIWGGYSQQTIVMGNEFADNGPRGRVSGGEGGGINIEHGAGNHIQGNRFAGNSVGVSLWWDDDGDLLKTPWAKANHRGSANNSVTDNTFEGFAPFIRLRKTTGTTLWGNRYQPGEGETAKPVDADSGSDFDDSVGPPRSQRAIPMHKAEGSRTPVGARAGLRGRENIIMTEWGPWDHASPLVRRIQSGGSTDVFELLNLPDGARVDIARDVGVAEEDVTGLMTPPEKDGDPIRMAVTSAHPGVFGYTLGVSAPGFSTSIRGVLVNCRWSVRFFPWTVDPRKDLTGWRAESEGPAARTVDLSGLVLKFANGGPSQLGLSPEITAAKLPKDHFGTIATTVLPLAPGRYRVTTQSDDGVRVVVRRGGVGGQVGKTTERTVLENWTWHAPATDRGEFVIEGPAGAAPEAVELLVEHFEIDGYAMLSLEIERVVEETPGRAPPP